MTGRKGIPPLAATPFQWRDEAGVVPRKSTFGEQAEEHRSAFRAFWERYGQEFKGVPAHDLPFEVLAKAAKDGNVKVFSVFLQGWLSTKRVTAPPGVFRFTLNPPSRGRKPKLLESLFAVWIYDALEKPTFGKLAKAMFPVEFAHSPKRVTDRVRQLYRSHTKREKSP